MHRTARRQPEFVGLTLIENDHPLVVAKARYRGHRLLVVEMDGSELPMAAKGTE